MLLVLILACTSGPADTGAPLDGGADSGVDGGATDDSGDTGPVEETYVPCSSPITAPVDVHQELLGQVPTTVLEGLVWTDILGCLAACDDRDDCVEAACTGGLTGADIQYRQTWTEVEDSGRTTRTGSTELVATLPEGAAEWSRIELTDGFEEVRYTEADGGRESTRSVAGAWTGRIAPHLPADASFTAERSTASDDCCWYEDDASVVDGCETIYDQDAPADGKAWTVHRAGQQVRVVERGNERFDAWLDGACVGEVDRSTGALIGPCIQPDTDEI